MLTWLLLACSRPGTPAALPADAAAAASLLASAQATLEAAPTVRFRDGTVEVVVMRSSASLAVVTRGAERFTAAARRVDQPGRADVVLNGMTYSFDPDAHRAGSVQATHGDAHGQALVDGVAQGGNRLRSTTRRYHLVEQDGALHVGAGNPDGGTGLSGATALLIAGAVPDNADTARLLGHPEHLGMPYTGIDRDRGLLWIVVRVSGAGDGWGPQAVRDAFLRLGAEDALAWDGGDSATLVLDGSVVEQPAPYKDRSIPYGLRFSATAE